MRQFVLGANVAIGAVTDATRLKYGQFGILCNKDGELVVADATMADVNVFQLMLGGDGTPANPVKNYPIHRNGFSYVKSEYSPASKLKLTIAIPNPKIVNGFTEHGDYSIIFAKKGTDFNQRNKWTASVHVPLNKSVDKATLIKGLVKDIENKLSGVIKATADSGGIIIEVLDNSDWAIKGADLYMSLIDYVGGTSGIGVAVITEHKVALNDAAYITDLANKAAADNGIEYTYRDAYMELYPTYPLNPLKQNDVEDGGFVVYTLRFAEPRAVTTGVTDTVKQIVQVAVPTGAACITALESFFNALANTNSSSGESDTDGEDTSGE